VKSVEGDVAGTVFTLLAAGLTCLAACSARDASGARNRRTLKERPSPKGEGLFFFNWRGKGRTFYYAGV